MLGHILIVDDDLLTRTTLSLILEDAGYTVKTVCDGVEALDQIGVSCPRLIISDIRLPQLNGLQLLELLRTNSTTQNLPVLLTSANTNPRLPEGMYSAFLEKPIDIDTLLAVVATFLAWPESSERTVGGL